MNPAQGKQFGNDRRKHPRLNAVMIVFTFPGEKDISSVKKIYLTKNISAGGICAIVPREIAPQTTLDLKVHLPDGSKPINVKGRVVWNQSVAFGPDKKIQHNSGIEFIDIDNNDRERISKYVGDHLNKNQP